MHRIYIIYQNWFPSGLPHFCQFFIYIYSWLWPLPPLPPQSPGFCPLSSLPPREVLQYLITWILQSNFTSSDSSHCVTLVKLHDLPKSPFPYLSSEENNRIYLLGSISSEDIDIPGLSGIPLYFIILGICNILSRMARMKRQKYQVVARIWGSRSAHTLLVEM